MKGLDLAVQAERIGIAFQVEKLLPLDRYIRQLEREGLDMAVQASG